MISIQNLTRCYGDVVAVDDVSVEIRRGEIVGLLGHNGAGKTTMMKILTGYLEPTRGTVKVDDVDVVGERQAVQERLGYLPESAPLYPEMRVHEYLRLIGELRGVPAETLEQALSDAASQTGLTGHLNTPISNLSKGFRQRVGIAQAILHTPDVLVLDEPTNGLDPVQIVQIRELIERLGQHATILLSTHILQEVEAVCDRVLVMIDGKLAADAPLAELLATNVVRLCVAAGTEGVQGTLIGLDEVGAARADGRDPTNPDLEWWSITPEPGATAVSQAILRAGLDAGWIIDSIGRETLNLEGVYKQLQQEHVDKQQAEA